MSPGQRARLRARATPAVAALAVGALGGALFVLLQSPFATVDGATHIGGAATLRDLVQGNGDLARAYLERSSWTAPNTLPELGLALLMLALAPGAAEALLVVGYVLALPLALLYAVRAWGRGVDALALVALPLTFSFTFLYGFYNFSYSVVLFLVVAGATARMMPGLSRRGAGILAALLLLTYATHLVGFLAAGLFVTVVAAAHARAAAREARRRLLLRAGAAITPSAALTLLFVISSGSADAVRRDPPLEVLAGTLSLVWGVVAYERVEIVVCCVLALALGVAAVAAVRERGLGRPRPEDAPLVFALVVLAVTLVAPAEVGSGGSFLTQRLALFPVYGLVLWLAARRPPRALVLAVGIVSVVAAIGLALARLPQQRALAADVRDVESVARCLATEATMAQVNLALVDPGSAGRMDPLSAEAGRLSAATGGLDLGNVAWQVPFYLLRFHPSRDPAGTLVPETTAGTAIQAVPPVATPLRYERETAGRLDYVLVFGRRLATRDVLGSRSWHALSADLEQAYERVAVSPRRLLEVWEHRGVGARGEARRASAPRGACRG